MKTENSPAVALAHIGHDAILNNYALELMQIMSSPTAWNPEEVDASVTTHYDDVLYAAVRHAARCANVIINVTIIIDQLKKDKGIA